MKRIAIIFIIVFCLLSFTGISNLAEKPFDYGEMWNSWSDYTRSIYIMGLKDGIQHQSTIHFIDQLLIEEKNVFDKYLKDSEVVEAEKKINRVLWDFLLLEDKSIRDVATDLYQDPANAYVSFYNMLGIAFRKIKGEDTESLLQKVREEELQIFKEKEENE